MEQLKKYTFYIVILSLLLYACKREQTHDHSDQASQEERYYTCPMHPSVRSDTPGSCPVCGMDLVKKTAKKAIAESNGEGEVIYTCPMHPTVSSDKPGKCPLCGMDLVKKTSSNNAPQAATSTDYYTCPMHPSVRSEKEGSCPICGMPLVKKEAGQSHENKIHLTERQQLLINLETDIADVKRIHENNLVLGTVVQNEKGVEVVSARIRGRVEKLYLRNPGERVKKGQLLYSLYSEELLAAQTDFVQALDQTQKFASQKEILDQLVEAARNKLRLWGMSEKQIGELSSHRKPTPYTNFFSGSTGYLADLQTAEGAYVEEGMPLFTVVDLSSLWVEAQLYPQEFSFLKQNPSVSIEFESLPGKEYSAKLIFSTPSLETNQKIGLARFAIENPDEQIKPGMMAYVRIKRGGKEALVIPKSALLLDLMKIVWVESEEGMFERRMVTTGAENKREVEILSGIEAGEKVVSSGAYLLNSEFILQQGSTQLHNH